MAGFDLKPEKKMLAAMMPTTKLTQFRTNGRDNHPSIHPSKKVSCQDDDSDDDNDDREKQDTGHTYARVWPQKL